MSLDDAIEEIRRHREAKAMLDRTEECENTIVDNIKYVVTLEQLKGWQVIESLLSGFISRSDIYISDERIREKLKSRGENS